MEGTTSKSRHKIRDSPYPPSKVTPSKDFYEIVRNDLHNLSDWLAGNASSISRLSSRLFASRVIPLDVHNAVQIAHNRPYDRANELFSSVLSTLKTHSTPSSLFIDFIESLEYVGLTTELIERLKRKGGYKKIKKEPHSPMQWDDSPSPVPRSPQVISLSSRSEVATSIELLHARYAVLVTELRKRFDELISSGQLKLIDINRLVSDYLEIPTFEGISTIDKLFDALLSHCDFFNCDVLDHLVQKLLSCKLKNEFSEYMKRVYEFSESTQLKNLRENIREKLQAIVNDTAELQVVVIKLEDRWKEITICNLKKVFKHYFGSKTSDTFHHIRIDYGSLIVKFLVPKGSLLQPLFDKITSQNDSMNRIGVLDTSALSHTQESTANHETKEIMNFEQSLRKSVTAGDSFETSFLLQLGADANSKNERGKTPLMLATEHEHTTLIDTLVVDGDADVNATDNGGRTALMIAKKKNNPVLIESLHKAEQESVLKNHMALIKGCEKGNIELVESFIERNISVNVILPNGSTPLIIACQNGHYDLVQSLVQHKVSLSTFDSKGYTALHYACQYGFIEIVSLLLKHNAPYCYTTDGITPLMLGSEHGHLPIIELLYSFGMTRHDGLQAMLVTESPEILELLATKCDVPATLTKKDLRFLSNIEVKRKENSSSVKWELKTLEIISPLPRQCREIVLQLKDNHEGIYIDWSSPEMIQLLVPPLLQKSSVKKLGIYYTEITLKCIHSLSLYFNTSIQELALSYCSITNEGVAILCQHLQANTTLTSLDLCGNRLITSASNLSKLITTNNTLTHLNIHRTSLSSDDILQLLDSLAITTSLKKLVLSRKNELFCTVHTHYMQIKGRLSFK